MTWIVACKANWWQTNHHTGVTRENPTEYVGKVPTAIFGANSPTYVTLAHTISHWCSTILILTKAGVQHLREDIQSAILDHADFTLGADAALRFASGPAEIHRFIVADAIASRIVQHSIIDYYHSPLGLVALHERTLELLNQGPRVHVGAHYLTGETRAQVTEELIASNLGRLGIWIKAFESVQGQLGLARDTEEISEKYRK